MATVNDTTEVIKEYRHPEDDGDKVRFRVWRKDGIGVESGDSVSLDDVDGTKGTTRSEYDSVAATINTYVGDTLTQQVSTSGFRDVSVGSFESVGVLTSGHVMSFNGTSWVNA